MPRKAQRRAELVALGGVVVDHVEDHLDVGLVQRLDHRLELLHLLAALAGGGVGVVRREEPDRVVAPVVRQPLVHQRGVLHELVHRHQLDRGDAELREVVDRGRVRDPGVRAADLLGHAGVGHREALDVRLVDDGVVVLVLRRAVAAPVEERVHDDRQHVVAEAVLVVERLGLVELVGEQRLVAVHLPVDRLGVGVEQQLRRVAAVPVLGLVGPVHAVAVALPGLDPGQVRVVHERVGLDHLHAGLGARVVDEAELHLRRHLGEEREVDPGPVVRRTQGVRASWPDLHALPLVGDPVDTGARLNRTDRRYRSMTGDPFRATYTCMRRTGTEVSRARSSAPAARRRNPHFFARPARGRVGPCPLRRPTPAPVRC